VELLLDFPKRQLLEVEGIQWEAVKHGTGVMFRGDGVMVDVPHGVGRPQLFDSDRFFDYLNSKKLLDLISAGNDQRERLAQLFLGWCDDGILERQIDELGRGVFSFRQDLER
jgi:hypothetical protein